MTNWRDIATENQKAAELLGNAASYRSCVSRAYYAAFSAVTSALAKHSVAYPNGRETPGHHKVTSLMSQYLASEMSRPHLLQLKATVRRLYNYRLVADYRSGLTVDERNARAARRDAHYVCKTLGNIR